MAIKKGEEWFVVVTWTHRENDPVEASFNSYDNAVLYFNHMREMLINHPELLIEVIVESVKGKGALYFDHESRDYELSQRALKVDPDLQLWREFKDEGWLWWINRILHTFGWAIGLVTSSRSSNRGEVLQAYAMRVNYNGFARSVEEKGYKAVRETLGLDPPDDEEKAD